MSPSLIQIDELINATMDKVLLACLILLVDAPFAGLDGRRHCWHGMMPCPLSFSSYSTRVGADAPFVRRHTGTSDLTPCSDDCFC